MSAKNDDSFTSLSIVNFLLFWHCKENVMNIYIDYYLSSLVHIRVVWIHCTETFEAANNEDAPADTKKVETNFLMMNNNKRESVCIFE